ncbi:MAG: hypothetical protein MUF81_10120 [Verrucomicrobia bacterium]|nr:hypothetical protein [Verrucomicrobiota bacterium]
MLNNEAMFITPRQPSARVNLALAFVVSLVEIAADIACALRLVQSQIDLCHFGNYFRYTLDHLSRICGSGRTEPRGLLVSPLCSEDEEPSQPTGTDDGPLIAGPFLHVSWPQRLS